MSPDQGLPAVSGVSVIASAWCLRFHGLPTAPRRWREAAATSRHPVPSGTQRGNGSFRTQVAGSASTSSSPSLFLGKHRKLRKLAFPAAIRMKGNGRCLDGLRTHSGQHPGSVRAPDAGSHPGPTCPLRCPLSTQDGACSTSRGSSPSRTQPHGSSSVK